MRCDAIRSYVRDTVAVPNHDRLGEINWITGQCLPVLMPTDVLRGSI